MVFQSVLRKYIDDHDESMTKSNMLNSFSAAVSSAADSHLPIVQSQRDRFRIRAQELEAVS